MAMDAIPVILDQIQCLPKGCKKVDILVVSSGGDPMVAWRIMSLLREKVDEVGVLVPQAAYSAATLLALGADEIVMHPSGNLGPVDPQITVNGKGDKGQSQQIQFGTEDLAGFLNFVKQNVGLSDQAQLSSAFELFCKEVGSVPIGVAARSSRLALSLSAKLLSMHMKTDGDKQKATNISATLNKEFFHHGYPVGRREAKELGLKVVFPEKKLETCMWNTWLQIEKDLKCRIPFTPLDEVAANNECCTLFGPSVSIQLPTNLPDQLRQQVIQQVLSQIHIVETPPVAYTNYHSLIESSRIGYVFKSSGRIFASKTANGDIAVKTVPLVSGRWCSSSEESSDLEEENPRDVPVNNTDTQPANEEANNGAENTTPNA